MGVAFSGNNIGNSLAISRSKYSADGFGRSLNTFRRTADPEARVVAVSITKTVGNWAAALAQSYVPKPPRRKSGESEPATAPRLSRTSGDGGSVGSSSSSSSNNSNRAPPELSGKKVLAFTNTGVSYVKQRLLLEGALDVEPRLGGRN